MQMRIEKNVLVFVMGAFAEMPGDVSRIKPSQNLPPGLH